MINISLIRKDDILGYKKTIYLFLYLSFSICSSFSQWIQTNGPPGGTVQALITSGPTIFAGTYNGGVFASHDGQIWRQTKLTSITVYSLASRDSTIFAGTRAYGVYSSTDFGNNWAQTSLGDGNFVYAIAINYPNVVAGTSLGVYYSTNYGLNWIQS